MINIAIVEDEKFAAQSLINMLKEYASLFKSEFKTTHYSNALSFLSSYKPNYDIIFMDIEMPDMNGMLAAEKLREIDNDVIIIFVTNMAKYAVKGYKVSALDFIVKPVIYNHLESVMHRAVKNIQKKQNEPELAISLVSGLIRLKASEIKYISIYAHTVTYYTDDGAITASGNLKTIEGILSPAGFVRCNSCYLVNLKYVTAVNGFTVTVGGNDLQISYRKKKEFMQSLNDYIGEGRIA